MALQEVIAACPYIKNVEISLDERSEYIGFIKGRITFTDDSVMHFKEFVDVETKTKRYKYGYHYEKSDRLIFRYDNVKNPKASKLATFPNHKHIKDRLEPSTAPTLEKVLVEVLDYLTI